MEQPTTPELQFLSNSESWIREIRGNILRLNDAASTMQADVFLPSRSSHPIIIESKINSIRNFIVELNRLYKNVVNVLYDYDDIRKRLQLWILRSSQFMDRTNQIDLKLIQDGLNLSDELQEVLYELGIKDIDVAGPTMFPFEYFCEVK